jgi:hypothetical protein
MVLQVKREDGELVENRLEVIFLVEYGISTVIKILF